MAISRLSIVKFLELALTCVCIGLHFKTIKGTEFEQILIAGTFGGYFIILCGGFLGHLISNPINRKIDILFCLAGCGLFIASGVLSIQHYEDYWKGETRNMGLAKAGVAIVNGAVFLVDSLLTWRGDY